VLFDKIYEKYEKYLLKDPITIKSKVRDDILKEYGIQIDFPNLLEVVFLYPQSLIEKYVKKIQNNNNIRILKREFVFNRSTPENNMYKYVLSIDPAILNIINYQPYKDLDILQNIETGNSFLKGKPAKMVITTDYYVRHGEHLLTNADIKYEGKGIISIQFYPAYSNFSSTYIPLLPIHFIKKELYYNTECFIDMVHSLETKNAKIELDKIINLLYKIDKPKSAKTIKESEADTLQFCLIKNTINKKISTKFNNVNIKIEQNIAVSIKPLIKYLKKKFNLDQQDITNIKKSITLGIYNKFNSYLDHNITILSKYTSSSHHEVNVTHLTHITLKDRTQTGRETFRFRTECIFSIPLYPINLVLFNQEIKEGTIKEYINKGEKQLFAELNKIISQSVKQIIKQKGGKEVTI